jgi:hypothetical protein
MVWTSEDGQTRYTHGPDCTTGPNCCCGACNFITLSKDCNSQVCCKCIPKNLCAVHYPYEPSETCVPRHTLMPLANSWQGSLTGIDTVGDNNLIEVFMQQLNYEECYFVVFIPARDITLFYPIQGGRSQCEQYPEFRQTCRDPYFVLEDFVLNGCNGRLVIERKLLKPVPFHANTTLQSLTEGEVPVCGQCSQYCTILCLEWSIGGEAQKTQFGTQVGVSTESEQVYWTALLDDGSTATIVAYEAVDGNCYLAIDHPGLEDFQPVMIPDGMCNLGMVIEAQGDYRWPNKSVSISCNKCTCWDYVCERCRCVCPTLCIVSVNGTQQTDIIRYELDWDPVKLIWGNEEKWVGVRANPVTGKCEFVISGWNDGPYAEYEPSESTIEIEECGADMSYFVTSDRETAFETGVFRFEYGVCKGCDPECFKYFCDDCCGDCDSPELPETLFFDIVGSTVAGEPEGSPPCLAVYDIPLVHTMPLFEESHRWEGHAIVDCTAVFESPPGPNSILIDIRISCSGDLWTLTVRLTSVSATGTFITVNSNDPIWTTSFSCSPVAWVGKLSSDLVITKCCGGVFEFDFAVSQ